MAVEATKEDNTFIRFLQFFHHMFLVLRVPGEKDLGRGKIEGRQESDRQRMKLWSEGMLAVLTMLIGADLASHK